MIPWHVSVALVAVVTLAVALSAYKVYKMPPMLRTVPCRHKWRPSTATISDPTNTTFSPQPGWAQFYRLGCVTVLLICTDCGAIAKEILAGKPLDHLRILADLVGVEDK